MEAKHYFPEEPQCFRTNQILSRSIDLRFTLSSCPGVHNLAEPNVHANLHSPIVTVTLYGVVPHKASNILRPLQICCASKSEL
jgi:hypothetical protein